MFSKKRKDANYVHEADPMIKLMPYLMKGRNESVVFYRKQIPITKLNEFIAEKRKRGV